MALPRRLWRGLVCLACGVLGGCSPARLVNALVPDDYRPAFGQSYGDGPRRTLDVYMPAATGDGRPVVVFFYGGNWQTGSKADYRFVGQALAARGFVVVIPDYRLYPEVRYPGFVEDGAAAVRWALANAPAFGGDPARVHLMGHSAGAYIALMLALDDRWLGPDRARVRGTVGLAGPYDFLPIADPTLQVVFGGVPDRAETQPISHADGGAAPVWLASGLSDTTVLPRNSVNLAARIRDRGGRAEERYYPGLGHVALVGALAAPLRFLAPVLEDAAAFLAGSGTVPPA